MVPSAPFNFPSLLMCIKSNILKVQVEVTLSYLDSLAATFPIITCAQSQNREQHAKNFTPETEGKMKWCSSLFQSQVFKFPAALHYLLAEAAPRPCSCHCFLNILKRCAQLKVSLPVCGQLRASPWPMS